MSTWKLRDAKNRFSEVVRRAPASEPQLGTRNVRDAVVVMRAEEYERLVAPRDLVAFLQESPLAKAFARGELELDRPHDSGRDIEL